MRSWLDEISTLTFDTGIRLREAVQSEPLRSRIRILAKHYFGETVTGCTNCLEDLFFRLKHLAFQEKQNYRIRRGAVLRDRQHADPTLAMTNANCTDLLAAYHLLSGDAHWKFFDYPAPGEIPAHVEELKTRYPGGASQVLQLLKAGNATEEVSSIRANSTGSGTPKSETTTAEE